MPASTAPCTSASSPSNAPPSRPRRRSARVVRERVGQALSRMFEEPAAGA
jgi:hypothetical protein